MISVAGISHATAAVAIRERLAVPTESLGAVLASLRERYGAAVLVSTCNRTELYLSAPGAPADDADLRAALLTMTAGGAQVPESAVYVRSGGAAARHLLRVASGLDSMLLGEDQILGQVRDALGAAAAAGTTDRLLSRLFHLAIATGRRVRTETAVGRHARSVSAAAVEALRARLGDLSDKTVLVVGAGAAGKLSAVGLRQAGVGRLLVASRTGAHAETLAAEVGGEPRTLLDLEYALRDCDAAICASSAPQPPVTSLLLRAVQAVRANRPLLLVDVAVPRDVAPAAAAVVGVTLLDIDALGGEGTDADAIGALEAAEAIVSQETARLEAWWETLRVVPTITALRGRAESVRRAELSRTLNRLPDLTERERERIEALTAAIVNKLLHEPIQRLKQPGTGAQYAAAVHDLFALPGPSPLAPFSATPHPEIEPPSAAFGWPFAEAFVPLDAADAVL